jgi:site-specific DNA recombinase
VSGQAAVYCRISQDRIGAGLGVDRQREDCERLAATLGFGVTEIHIDNDVSAYSGKSRPGYTALLDSITAGEIDAVLVWHLDRLHRSPLELEHYITVCEPRGVPTHSVRSGPLDLSSATGRMTARIAGAVSRHESELKAERVHRAKQQAQADGKWLGGRRPLGYEPDGVTLRESEADEIRAAIRDVLVGDSLRSIATRWNAASMTTVTGKRWSTSAVRAVLLRPRNAGLVGNLKRVDGEAGWPAIVDRETWDALRQLLSDPNRLTRSGGTSRKLLGSFLYFCECGARVTSGGQTRHGVGRYACPEMHLRRAATEIDYMVKRFIEKLLRERKLRAPVRRPDTQPLRERLSVLRAREIQVATLIADPDSGMTSTQFKAANDQIQAQIAATRAELRRLTGESALAGVLDAEDPVAAFRAANMDRQREVIDGLATVTLLRTRAGRQPDGSYFDPASVRITPKGQQA